MKMTWIELFQSGAPIQEARKFNLHEITERTKLIYGNWKQINSCLGSSVCKWGNGSDWLPRYTREFGDL